MMKQTLQIEGMHCGSCVSRVDKALRSVPGVQAAAVNLTTGLASVESEAPVQFLDEQTAALVLAVHRIGYTATPLRDTSNAVLQEVGQRSAAAEERVKMRLWVGIVLGLPVVAYHMLMLPAFPGSVLIELLAATAIMAITGWPYLVRGIPALFRAQPDMDTLVALGSATAYLASIPLSIAALRHGTMPTMHHANFEYHAAITIVVLVTLGKYLEARAKKRAGAAVGSLAVVTGQDATLLGPDGTITRVRAEALNLEDHVQVAAHQIVPVDGEVIEGAGSLDQSLLTGESVPVSISPGANVAGGALLVDGRIVLRATATAAHSTIARITELVQQAQASRTNIQRLADRVAGIFVPIVLALGLLTFAGWMLLSGNSSKALMATIATVVIACPCAMGLATPTAITVAMGRGAKLGILFTKATALETACTIDTVLFDKTGTLTRGQLAVAQIDALGNDANAVLSLAGTLEQYSQHPIGQAIMRHVIEHKIAFDSPDDFSSVPGGGLKGKLSSTGILPVSAGDRQDACATEILVGSMAYVEAQHIPVARHTAVQMEQQGMTVVAVAAGGRLMGLIGLRDQLRDDAAATIAQLHTQGIQVGVVSGDSEAAVRGALGNIKVDLLYAGVRPEEKANIIKELSAVGSHHVAFVGDGTNDAPALAAADLGIAMAGSTDLARAAGDVLLVSPRLSAVPQALALAEATLHIIRQNLVWAFVYNIFAIPAAMLNILPPGMASRGDGCKQPQCGG